MTEEIFQWLAEEDRKGGGLKSKKRGYGGDSGGFLLEERIPLKAEVRAGKRRAERRTIRRAGEESRLLVFFGF